MTLQEIIIAAFAGAVTIGVVLWRVLPPIIKILDAAQTSAVTAINQAKTNAQDVKQHVDNSSNQVLAEFREMSRSLADLSQKYVDNLTERMKLVEDDNTTLKKTAYDQRVLIDDNTNALKAAADQTRQHETYIKTLEQLISEHKTEMNNLSHRYEVQMAEQGKQINDKDNALADKDARIKELTAQVNELIANLETESKLVATLTQRVTALESDVAALKSQLQSKDIELKATLLNKAELESKLALVTAERDAAYKERDEQVSRMQIEIDTLRTALDDLTAKFSALSPVTETPNAT